MDDGTGNGAAMPEGLSTRQAARRQRMLDAALGLLEVRDYERISVREVAESASVALATLYHYFPSKEHLFAEALIQWASSLGASVTNRPLTGTTPALRVEEALLRSVRAFERRPQLARLIGRLEMSEEAFARDVLARLDAVTTDVYLGLLADLPPSARRSASSASSMPSSTARCRAWSSGRSSIRDVRSALSDAVALLFPDAEAGQRGAPVGMRALQP